MWRWIAAGASWGDTGCQDDVKDYLPEDCDPAIVELLQFRYEELEIDEYLEELRKKRRDWIVKLDKTQPLYILYGCNIVKERSTMRLVAATTDEEMLQVIIGSQILLGVMDYRGFSNMKGLSAVPGRLPQRGRAI